MNDLDDVTLATALGWGVFFELGGVAVFDECVYVALEVTW